MTLLEEKDNFNQRKNRDAIFGKDLCVRAIVMKLIDKNSKEFIPNQGSTLKSNLDKSDFFYKINNFCTCFFIL